MVIVSPLSKVSLVINGGSNPLNQPRILSGMLLQGWYRGFYYPVKNHIKDPYYTTRIMECDKGFECLLISLDLEGVLN